MAGRQNHLSVGQQAEIGQAVRQARQIGLPWKTLAAIYNRSPRQLRRCMLLRRDVTSFPCGETDVTSSLLRNG